MAQLVLDLDPDTDARIRAAAQAAGLSVTRWLTDLLRAIAASPWPDDVVALAGAWRDAASEPAMAEHPAAANDIPREPL